MRNSQLSAPASITVVNGNLFAFAPWWKVDDFEMIGFCIDVTCLKAGDTKYSLRSHRKGLEDVLQVSKIERMADPDGRKVEGRPVILERIFLTLSGTRCWTLLSDEKAFEDFDPEKDVHRKIEIRRLVLENTEKVKGWNEVVPVCDPKVVLGEVNKTSLSTKDFPELKPELAAVERVDLTKGKPRVRVLMLDLPDGIYALRLPTMDSGNPADQQGSCCHFDFLELGGHGVLDANTRIHCTEFGEGEKGRKVFKILSSTLKPAGVWIAADGTAYLKNPEDQTTKCETVSFKLGEHEGGYYPLVETAQFSTTFKKRKQKKVGTSRNETSVVAASSPESSEMGEQPPQDLAPPTDSSDVAEVNDEDDEDEELVEESDAEVEANSDAS